MTAEQPKYAVHQGDDYLEITGPTGMVLVARYPDNEDRDQAEEMVKQLTAMPETAAKRDRLIEVLESVKSQFGPTAHRYGCECGGRNPPNDSCGQTRRKVLDALFQARKP